jgi:hypothetical protein
MQATSSTFRGSSADRDVELGWMTLVAAVAGLAAIWLAAGLIGFFANPIRWTSVACLLAICYALARPRILHLPFAGVAGICAAMVAVQISDLLVGLVVVTVLASIAAGSGGMPRRVFWCLAIAGLGPVLWQYICQTVPTAWFLGDRMAAGLGTIASTITGQPVQVGATFAGVNILFVMLLFWMGWLTFVRRPLWRAGGCALVAILLGHIVYLALVAFLPELVQLMPKANDVAASDPYVPPPFQWSTWVHGLIPWNIPLLAGVIHGLIAIGMLRWSSWRPLPADKPTSRESNATPQVVAASWKDFPLQAGIAKYVPRWLAEPEAGIRDGTSLPQRFSSRLKAAAPFLLAAFLPIVGTWNISSVHLREKRILICRDSQVDWRLPMHDSYGQASAGEFGMLPALVCSLGGETIVTNTLTSTDLAEVDLLVLLNPDYVFSDDQVQSIMTYLRTGGNVLLAGHGFEPGRTVPFQQLLKSTGITIRQDGAVPASEDWQGTTWGSFASWFGFLPPSHNRCLSDRGASQQIRWPARPLLVGRWAWSAPEVGVNWRARRYLVENQKLGDLVLAAEQKIGAGRLYVLGDAACLTNEGLVDGYDFASRLLNRATQPHSWASCSGRQMLHLMCGGALILMILLQPRLQRLIVIAVALAIGISVSVGASTYAGRVIPQGRLLVSGALSTPIRHVAYIDSSHLESFSRRYWGYDGIDGLALNLMRNGYLPLTMPEVSAERLSGADLVILIAPARSFSAKECRELEEFVRGGGVLISMIGAEDAAANHRLLDEFGVSVAVSPVPTCGDAREPEPMGRFRTLYFDGNLYGVGDYQTGVTFHNGWPVTIDGASGEVLVYGMRDEPIVVQRVVGQGSFVLIGDSDFALNKNLEYVGGETFDGKQENANFWRWLLSRVGEGDEWIPPPSNDDLPNPESGSSDPNRETP